MRILIVDDHPVIHNALATLFRKDVGDGLLSAFTAQEGFTSYCAHKPDVSIIDIKLPDASGFELMGQIKAVDAEARMVCFSMRVDARTANRAMQAGAKAFAGKTDDPAMLREAVLRAAAGERWLPDRLRQEVAWLRLKGGGPGCELSMRELAILRCLSRGHSLGEIGHELRVSYKTVTNEVANLREKLRARTQPEMIRIAMEKGLLG